MDEELSQFLRETRDAREYKRALAVKLSATDLPYETISRLLDVSPSFISKWKRIYHEQGITGFQMGYLGSSSYLTEEERTQTIAWLHAQERWNVADLQTYLKTTFDVAYQSLQSYYDLLHAAGLSWQKTQAQSPKKTRKPSQPSAKN
jgi:putative transposase